MDIDKLFKVPMLPKGGNKRKMPEAPTPEMLKRIRVDTSLPGDKNEPTLPQDSAHQKRPSVTIEEMEDEEVDRNFAPGGDADYFVEEDEEGRFFGGGLTEEQKEILNIFDKSSGEGAQEDVDFLSITSIRRLLLRLERAVNKNQDQRSKYPDDPTKFIDSEADLDSAIKALLPLSQSPVLAYPELMRFGSMELLVGLLTHENMDIVIDVVELINELTDEDVGNEGEENVAEEAGEVMKDLIESLLEKSVLELLVDNLMRLNESEEADKQGVFHILGIFENLLGFNPDLATQLVAKTKIMSWLLTRIQSKYHDENKGYAAELLSIILQTNATNRLEMGKEDGVEILLKVLSQFRRRDPVDADEAEFMDNIFDSLCSSLSESSIKKAFLEAEGPDLMVLMMKEKLQSNSRASKTLDYAMSGTASSLICEAFVEALGLKTLFSAFMGKIKKQKSAVSSPPSEDVAHILGIMSSLLSNLPSDSTARIRLLTKFVEGDYEKVDKLLEIRDNARQRLKTIDNMLEAERKQLLENGEEITSDEEDMWYLRRLDSGLFTMQTVDYILAWIFMEDDGIRAHGLRMLSRKNQTLGDIVQTLRIYHDNVDGTLESNISDEQESGPSQKDILQNLILALGHNGRIDTYSQ
ncbi:hypothetical protein AMATHDRAFT_139367 [Amanita thiersii Skay4041]|uniref:Beta-catenin-like protein 1 N-terminal domain-containing protein n=1 Tax=Amanita thiersii Skay4041 TaxID=703135 RepID=A0A2A9NRM1_9AGAR|nr:hypothetical protein AMATHDRAFT_139367 [Amanita thiersii Skay4041]